jgi:hypothetical protein
VVIAVAIALLGVGLMIEPNATAQPAGDTSPQPLRQPAEPEPARLEPQAMGVSTP